MSPWCCSSWTKVLCAVRCSLDLHVIWGTSCATLTSLCLWHRWGCDPPHISRSRGSGWPISTVLFSPPEIRDVIDFSLTVVFPWPSAHSLWKPSSDDLMSEISHTTTDVQPPAQPDPKSGASHWPETFSIFTTKTCDVGWRNQYGPTSQIGVTQRLKARCSCQKRRCSKCSDICWFQSRTIVFVGYTLTDFSPTPLSTSPTKLSFLLHFQTQTHSVSHPSSLTSEFQACLLKHTAPEFHKSKCRHIAASKLNSSSPDCQGFGCCLCTPTPHCLFSIRGFDPTHWRSVLSGRLALLVSCGVDPYTSWFLLACL